MGVFILLRLALSAMAEDGPPTMLWQREYFPGNTAKFTHVDEAGNGDFLVAGYRIISGQTRYCALRFSEIGDLIWQWEPGYLGQLAYWIEELSDGSVILCGGAIESSGSEYGVLVAKLSAGGDTEWVNIIPAPYGMGMCITPIPSNSYAVCGYIDDYDPLLMRIDSQGDTLWTRVWETGWARARRVVYYDNGLVMFVDGSYGYGPLLIRYDLDGNLEWVSDFTGEFESSTEWGGSMCLTPGGGGYTFASEHYSWIVGADWSGEEQWSQEIYGDMGRVGLSINPTMDGGYIFSGWGSYWGPPGTVDMHSAPTDTGTTPDGWLVKMDLLGNHEWHVFNSLGARANYFNCVQQLSQGGYIVAGQIWDTVHSNWNGYLLRYAPETGIGEGESSEPGLVLHPSSNPFGSSVTITCSGEALPEELYVFDLSGRCVRSLVSLGSSFTWNGQDASGRQIPVGTYLIQGAVDGSVSSIRVVKL